MKKLVLHSLFTLFYANLFGQQIAADRLTSLFSRQLKVFPQEKIYLHTDKPYYISGEQIWFRAHLVDAAVHTPAFAGRYIYVELINPLDTIVARVKIRRTDSIYCGYIALSPDLPEGDYTLRAYTHFMQSLDEHYLHTKNIRIGDPQARNIRVDTKFDLASDNKFTAEFRLTHPTLHSAVVPESVKVSINGGKQMKINTDDHIAGVKFDLPSNASKRVMLLEIEKSKHIYRQFISIPVPDNDFDVTFHPEGGNPVEEAFVRVAFKALKSNGKSSEITGIIYDNHGEEITRISSVHCGMGIFGIHPEKGKTYHALCTNEKGEIKRFDLPVACRDQYALYVGQRKGNLHISTLKPAAAAQTDTLYLLAHTRGVVHYSDMWPNGKTTVIIPNGLFPSGVLHLLLLDAHLRPLSERLVFIRNDDQATVDFCADRNNYARRSPVRAEVSVTDADGHPLEGNFSVSVTDDREVIADTCNNILTSLLLTSDLRGYIENPASYFQDNARSQQTLDLLMLTQGWRRYDVPALIEGKLSQPAAALEIGSEISGRVKGILTGKAAAGIDVSAFAINQKFFDQTETDRNGNFRFLNCEFPDSTHFIVYAVPTRGVRRMELILDTDSFPERTLPAVAAETVDRNVFVRYADKAEQKYTHEHGERVINLSEVTITADQKPKREYKSVYYNMPDNSFTQEDLDKFHPSTTEDLYNLLRLVPGVRVFAGRITMRGGKSLSMSSAPLILIDDFPVSSLEDVNVYDIAQIDILKNASILGMRGANGAIVIHTKLGEVRPPDKQFHVKFIAPVGYQKAAEFYTPKYDTYEKRENNIPDLRTTIHWQPAVQVNKPGKTGFSFYTADSETTYTVVIEGLTTDGKIIRKKSKIERRR